ncbi:MAG: hypothetical protein JWO12_391 [Frankiales bacterium]|nr:hypothetical protein [Frankiales bacterium]
MLKSSVTRPFVVVSAAVLLMSPCLAATADTRHPTPAELKAAHQRVAAAKSTVQSLQVRAERAAEAYNGAHSLYVHAVQDSRAANLKAISSAAVYTSAKAKAAEAQTVADVATAKAEKAAQAAQLALQTEQGAQLSLDRFAAGAYTTGGQMGMAAQLFATDDPAGLAGARDTMNQVSAYQKRIVNELASARVQAVTSATAATKASAAAVGSARVASTALAVAEKAKTAFATANHDAVVSARTAGTRLKRAMSYKHKALVLVAQAESSLGSAVHRAATLERDAAAARAAAAHVTSGKAPSDAAATAIHWAFQEIGVPYSWGGGDENGPTYGFAQGANTRGFDCSGLTLFAYAHAGIHLDHYTGSQWDEGKRISSRSDLQPGDLMFFAYDTSSSSTIHHVAIYIGNGKMIEAPQTGDVVKVSSYSRGDFIGATRPWQS